MHMYNSVEYVKNVQEGIKTKKTSDIIATFLLLITFWEMGIRCNGKY